MNEQKQIVITDVWGIKTLLYMENNEIYDVVAGAWDENSSRLGNVYTGKVKNIVKNINAAFVEIQERVLCYLPLSESNMDTPIHCGDVVIVQIKKAAVKNKKAVATRFPELVGRYCVISSAGKHRRISKKITNQKTRDNLSQILSELEEEPYGILLRTQAEEALPEAIMEECRTLIARLHKIMEQGVYRTGFSLLYEEAPFFLSYLLGCREGEIGRIVTDDPEVYSLLQEHVSKMGIPPRLQLYEDESFPIDKLYGITSRLKKAFDKRVWLKSGANLIIEPTEALTVIDVNTGKAVEGKRNKETTFFRINCEAAKEAARQIRIRGMSGIILIDFIDMRDKDNERKLIHLLSDELKKDKIKASIMDITKLGLIEITRMKKRPPLSEIYRGKIPDI